MSTMLTALRDCGRVCKPGRVSCPVKGSHSFEGCRGPILQRRGICTQKEKPQRTQTPKIYFHPLEHSLPSRKRSQPGHTYTRHGCRMTREFCLFSVTGLLPLAQTCSGTVSSLEENQCLWPFHEGERSLVSPISRHLSLQAAVTFGLQVYCP